MILIALACTATVAPTDAGVDPMLEDSVYVLQSGGLAIDGAEQGMNDLARLLLSNEILMQVRNVSDDAFDVAVAFGSPTDPIVRDVCTDEVVVPDVERTGLSFAGGPRDVVIDREAGAITLEDMEVAGTFTEDGDEIDDFVLTGTADLRLADGTALGPAADLCHTFAGFGVPCAACDDGELLCASIVARQLGARRQAVDFAAYDPDAAGCE